MTLAHRCCPIAINIVTVNIVAFSLLIASITAFIQLVLIKSAEMLLFNIGNHFLRYQIDSRVSFGYKSPRINKLQPLIRPVNTHTWKHTYLYIYIC